MAKKGYVFPGQGAQFSGMGKDLYEKSEVVKVLFDKANDILGFRITDIMFSGSEDELKQTNVTQPAVFLHSVAVFETLGVLEGTEKAEPNMVAGHSLGEFSALVAAKALSFEDGLKLVAKRAEAMQKACELAPSTMAAILGLADEKVEEICAEVSAIEKEVVVPANYNSPGQIVISGTIKGVEIACEKCKEAGAKRALMLKVGGAFHSPLMEPARVELAQAIEQTVFSTPICPIYQNVDGKPYSDSAQIKQNLIAQLTSPVRWTQIVKNMLADGAEDFIECGPGTVLTGLIGKIKG
ncbi:MAG: ACP S-malonyltransferase [Bacteroidales bacterium]|jgi:[acyl-carrier-protein] S-malonyltransferase|nr:ACP S-malonyltransferase [Bacteroidales bacterium]